MNLIQHFLDTGLVLLFLMTGLWILSLVLKNTSIVDIFWGTGFAIVVWLYRGLAQPAYTPRQALICWLVTIWGLRLTLHIFMRNWGEPEDFRYQKWRQEFKRNWWWISYFQAFILQGALIWVLSIPLYIAQVRAEPQRLTWLDGLGVLAWIIGFFFEAVGDWQLAQFRADPANRQGVLQKGLWRYTRHPNYFGDALQWWGFFLLCAATGAWWTLFSPLLMTFLLLRVSGVTLVERKLKEDRPGYRDYIQRTSAFIPWFPKPERRKEIHRH